MSLDLVTIQSPVFLQKEEKHKLSLDHVYGNPANELRSPEKEAAESLVETVGDQAGRDSETSQEPATVPLEGDPESHEIAPEVLSGSASVDDANDDDGDIEVFSQTSSETETQETAQTETPAVPPASTIPNAPYSQELERSLVSAASCATTENIDNDTENISISMGTVSSGSQEVRYVLVPGEDGQMVLQEDRVVPLSESDLLAPTIAEEGIEYHIRLGDHDGDKREVIMEGVGEHSSTDPLKSTVASATEAHSYIDQSEIPLADGTLLVSQLTKIASELENNQVVVSTTDEGTVIEIHPPAMWPEQGGDETLNDGDPDFDPSGVKSPQQHRQKSRSRLMLGNQNDPEEDSTGLSQHMQDMPIQDHIQVKYDRDIPRIVMDIQAYQCYLCPNTYSQPQVSTHTVEPIWKEHSVSWPSNLAPQDMWSLSAGSVYHSINH